MAQCSPESWKGCRWTAISPDDINRDLERRQQGYGSGGRMQIEDDQVWLTGA